jgi:hypothetical protein
MKKVEEVNKQVTAVQRKETTRKRITTSVEKRKKRNAKNDSKKEKLEGVSDVRWIGVPRLTRRSTATHLYVFFGRKARTNS